MKILPPVRLDAPQSIQPTPTFAKPALARSCVCLRIRVLLIWEWVANPTACLHCNKLHAGKPLDCNRTGGNFANLYPINTDLIDPKNESSFQTGPFVPYMYNCGAYQAGVFPYLTPIWFTDWRDETLAWHLTCSLYAHLNPSPLVIIKGPEAKKFMSENFVNNIEKFPIGVIKHGIMCTEDGLIATHGVIMRIGEDSYEAYWHSPYIEYAFQTKKYDAELIDISEKKYLFQLQGPRCLEILERLTGDNLHDIQYRHFRESSIDGHKVRILRLGMSGTLAYEIHGEIEYAREVYKKLIEIGNPYGIRPIGFCVYTLDHTLGGFPQNGTNFISAMYTDKGFEEYMGKFTGNANAEVSETENAILYGSAGSDVTKRMFNPIEVGLGHCINWKHEFRGKDALQEYAKNKKRTLVTLEWNVEDIITVYASQFQKEEDIFRPMDFPGAESACIGIYSHSADLIFDAEGNEIGISIGRTQSHYYRVMLSLASLDLKYIEIGTEVYALWGGPGSRQMKIRARVAPVPYNQHLTNADYDVSAIPQTNG